MISSDDHPGLFTFMVGLIVVVFAGVGLSLLVDRKFSFSRQASSLDTQLAAGATELEQLKAQHRDAGRGLSELEPKRLQLKQSLASLRQRLSELSRRNADLLTSREKIKSEIPSIAEQFAGYRTKYRNATWLAAVGQSLGTLTVRGGKEYHQAVINRVTDVGLEIRHENGIARVQAPDLDQAMQDRFQWNDEERRARLNEEKSLHDSIAGAIPKEEPQAAENAPAPEPVRPSIPKRQSADPADAKVESMRSKVVMWRTRVSRIGSERSQALSGVSYGKSSVPGSLETWEAKASRLGTQLAQAKAQLAAAKASLAAVSPGDPLLRPEMESPRRIFRCP